MSIYKKYLFTFLIVSLVPLLIIAIISEYYAETSLLKEIHDKLEDKSHLQKENIDEIIAKNMERIALVTSRTQLRICLNKYLLDKDQKCYENIQPILKDVLNSVKEFLAISIVSNEGIILISTLATLVNRNLDDVYKTNNAQLKLSKIIYRTRDKSPILLLSGPLIFENKLIGMLLIESDMAHIFNFIEAENKRSSTGELVLIDLASEKYPVCISAPRFQTIDPYFCSKGTFFNTHTEEQLAFYKDYRGKDVVAANSMLENINWMIQLKIDKSEAWIPVDEFRIILIAILSCVVIAVIWVSAVCAKAITTPIFKITRYAQNILDDKPVEPCIVPGNDEIGVLSQYIERMTLRLKSTNETLAENIAVLNDEVILRINAEKELLAHKTNLERLVEEQLVDIKKSKIIAETANQAKSEFLTNMSHEIRTPLNAIIGYAQILLNKELDSLEIRAMTSIEKNGIHLLSLVNEILDLSKIESGKMEVIPNDFSILELIKDLSSMFEMRCIEKNIRWILDSNLSEENSRVFGDLIKIKQILVNLIGNAIKFTDFGFVSMAIHYKADHEFYFEVKDSGAGIAIESKKNIFETFYQGEQGKSKGGTGLGLSLAKKQVELLGGKLGVMSEPNKGAVFYFTLQLPKSNLSYSSCFAVEHKVKYLEAGFDVLAIVADDLEDNRAVLSHILRNVGVRVLEAKNGKEAVSLTLEHEPDIVFMDYRMPEMDGIEAAKIIKSNVGDLINIAFVTASAYDEQQEHYKLSKCCAVITKPYNISRIYDVLAQSLNVKFVYEENNSEFVNGNNIELSSYSIGEEILTAIKDAIDIGCITDIDRQLVVLAENAQNAGLVNVLRKLLDQLKFEEMSHLLEDLSNAHV